MLNIYILTGYLTFDLGIYHQSSENYGFDTNLGHFIFHPFFSPYKLEKGINFNRFRLCLLITFPPAKFYSLSIFFYLDSKLN